MKRDVSVKLKEIIHIFIYTVVVIMQNTNVKLKIQKKISILRTNSFE